MPTKRIGLIGRRLVGVFVAAVGCTLAAFTYENLAMAALLGLVTTVSVFAFNNNDQSWDPPDIVDAWIGGSVALGFGGMALLVTGSDVACSFFTFALTVSWRTSWTIPSLDAEATRRLVEQMVAKTWRVHPGFLLQVTRRDSSTTPAPVGFDVTSSPTTVELQAYADCVQAFRSPFLLRVVFAPDAYRRTPYDDLSEYISPRLATVVDLGSLRELDTETPIWSLPTSAHGRMAFEAQVAQA